MTKLCTSQITEWQGKIGGHDAIVNIIELGNCSQVYRTENM